MRCFIKRTILLCATVLAICSAEANLRVNKKDEWMTRKLQDINPADIPQYMKDMAEASNDVLDVVDRVDNKVKQALGYEIMKEVHSTFKNQISELKAIVGDDVETTLIEQSVLLNEIIIIRQDLTGLSMQLKTGAETLKEILAIGNDEMAPDELAYLFEANREVLKDVLVKTSDACDKAKISLVEHSTKLAALVAKLKIYQSKCNEAQQANSQYLIQAADKMRVEAYASCVASVLGGPTAVALCYSIAAGIIEGEKIPGMQKQVQLQAEMLSSMASNFETLATSADEARNFAIAEREHVITLQIKIDSQRGIVLNLKYNEFKAFQTLMNKSLDKIIEACTQYINEGYTATQ